MPESRADPAEHQRRTSFYRVLANCLRQTGRGIADFVIPPCCVGCQKPLAEGHALCAACWRDIHFIRPPVCNRLGTPLPFDTGELTVSAAAIAAPPDYDRARAVAHHAGLMRRLIAGFKYADRHDARLLLARWLASAGADLIADADLIVPVPLHRWRLLHRRYNQSAILAKELLQITGKPVAYRVLLRTRRTKQQVGLRGAERRQNPRGAFAVPARCRRYIEGRRVLLIDDVITSGATANACARALKAGGARAVDVLGLSLATGEPFDIA